MSRAVPVVAAGAALVLLAGLAVVVLQRADSSEPYGEQAAVEAFRSASPEAVGSPASGAVAPQAGMPAARSATPAPAQETVRGAAPETTSPPVPAASRPAGGTVPRTEPDRQGTVEPGVYRYATEGHEEADALGGARHDYPATSSITYTRRDCGTEERWQPLEGRVSTSLYCDGADGRELRATYQEREFFGQSQSESYRCDPGVLVRPTTPRPGQRWTGRCRSDDSTVSIVGQVVALEELDVDGARVPVVRIAIQGTVTGSVRGRSHREVWLARANGLMVQATGDTDTTADTPAGPVRYRESYRLRLQSLTPRR